jgi:uncharacterized membrane protein
MGNEHWFLQPADLLAAAWLLVCWIGYAEYARRRAKTTFCIASVLHTYREQWMHLLLHRENRMTDASLISSLERNASFLASTAILVIAGLVTTLASVDQVHETLATMPFSETQLSPLQLQFKISLLLLIYIYSFFTFTWSMRQYGFCAIILGAAPLTNTPQAEGAEAERFAHHAAKIIDQAGLSYNYGLRAYYFSLSVLAWLINIWFFIAAVAIVVAILYAREFHSKTLKAMIQLGNLTHLEKP